MLIVSVHHKKYGVSPLSGQCRIRKRQRTPLALLVGLLICGAAGAAEDQIFDGARTPADYSNKLLTIRGTPNSLGPIQRSELGASAPSHKQDSLLDQRHSRNKVSVQSGTVTGHVYGASPTAANTPSEHNTVSVANGTVKRHVYGTYSSGTASSAQHNKVIVSGGQVHGAVVGAYASGRQADAADNIVTITGGMLGSARSAESRAGNVYGGYSANGTASQNQVHINGQDLSIRGSVFGGASRDSLGLQAQNNTVTITAGTVAGQVIGGIGARAAGGLADGNKVIINGEKAHIQGEIRGGTGRNASNNTVHISSGTITHDVIGGYNTFGTLRPGTPKMLATGNKIIIEGQPNFAARRINGRAILPSLYGGFSTNPDPNKRDVLSDNTLEMRTSGVTLRNIHNFERINFYLPATIQADDTVLTLNDVAGANITLSKVGVELPTGAHLKKGQRITLIHASAGTLKHAKGDKHHDLQIQSSSKSLYTFKLSQEGNRLFATVLTDGSTPDRLQSPANQDTLRPTPSTVEQ